MQDTLVGKSIMFPVAMAGSQHFLRHEILHQLVGLTSKFYLFSVSGHFEHFWAVSWPMAGANFTSYYQVPELIVRVCDHLSSPSSCLEGNHFYVNSLTAQTFESGFCFPNWILDWYRRQGKQSPMIFPG